MRQKKMPEKAGKRRAGDQGVERSGRLGKPSMAEPIAAPPPRDLGLDMPTGEKFKALKSAAEYFNSDLTQVTGYDNDGELLHVAVFARGPYAVPLEKFLKRLRKQEDAKEKSRGGDR